MPNDPTLPLTVHEAAVEDGQPRELTPEWWRERLRRMMNRPDCPPDIKKRCRQMLAEAKRRKRQKPPLVVIRIILD